jgi:3,4-dihydroxy 2-butanone 4-phosphate synthase
MKSLNKALKDLARGRPVLVYDADGREEETDIVFASNFVKPEDMRFMRQHGGGLICATILASHARKLGLPFLVDIYKSASSDFPVLKKSLADRLPYDEKSAFSLAFNHRKCYTGITDLDRALTISEFGKLAGRVDSLSAKKGSEAFPSNFRIPGHVFLLRTSEEILKTRFGHTELATALCVMAGLPASAAICEMMGEDDKALSKRLAKRFAQSKKLQYLEGYEVVEAWKKWCE